MSTYPESSRQSEIKPDSNPNTKHIQSSYSPPKQEHNNPGGEAAQNSGKKSAITCLKRISRWKKSIYNPEFKRLKAASYPASKHSTKVEDLINFIEADLLHITDEAKELKKYETRLSHELGNLRSRFSELKSLKEEDKKDDKTDDKKVEQLNEFRKNLMKLKLTIPSKYKIGSEKNGYDKYFKFIIDDAMPGDMTEKMPQLHHGDDQKSTEFKDFKTSMEFKDFEFRYTKLEDRYKLCLLCFAIFPQDATIKMRLMLQWWVVEGFASDKDNAAKIFNELMAKGFIEPVNDNRSPTTGSCRVHPFHHSALVALAEREKMFNFKNGGDPTQDFSDCFQACLMGEGLISHDDFKNRKVLISYEEFKLRTGSNISFKDFKKWKVYEDRTGSDVSFKDFNQDFKRRTGSDISFEEFKKMNEGPSNNNVIRYQIQELEKLHLLMNVDEHIIEFIDEWFSKMTNLNILYLGRWKASAIHHIEVEDSKFLKKLGELRYVKFLSLQGVSNIISLPDSVLKLTYLDVLDLRACSGLESIPEGIGSLESLTHLDMSECYLLAHMPKTLSRLKRLKVLKGFFVTADADSKSSCTLGDLKELKNLEKLCIYTDSKSFPKARHLDDLCKLKSVAKLTITWGVGLTKPPASESKSESAPEPASAFASAGRLPPNLKKLVLKCFPKKAAEEELATPKGKPKSPEDKPKKAAEEEPATPNWLKVENLEGLEKLYIRGGKFSDLGQFQKFDGESESESESKMRWKVKVLRLKYLSEIEMEWTQLQDLFPELEYLENVSCPKLTLFPCDAKGVWTKPH